MNTVIVAITTFCAGLIFGAMFLSLCGVHAFEFEDNSRTRFQLQQQQQDLERLQDEQLRYEREDPCRRR